jgi:hypothetical protein
MYSLLLILPVAILQVCLMEFYGARGLPRLQTLLAVLSLTRSDCARWPCPAFAV